MLVEAVDGCGGEGKGVGGPAKGKGKGKGYEGEGKGVWRPVEGNKGKGKCFILRPLYTSAVKHRVGVNFRFCRIVDFRVLQGVSSLAGPM